METFEFLGFGPDAWITLATVFTMFTVLLFTKIRSDVVFLCAVGILYVTGVLDAKEALSGISQTSFIHSHPFNKNIDYARKFHIP